MAVSSTTSSTAASAVTTSSIDVASIVSQLMSVENQPLNTLKTKITSQQTVISDLGKIKSDVAALQDTLGIFENASTFSNLTATSTDSSVVTATTGVGASAGTHIVSVTQAAQATSYNITGFSTNKDLINLDPTNGFQITVGNSSYNTNGTKTVGGVASANAITVIGKTGADTNNQPASTVADLQTWINSLNLNISAGLIQQNGNHWALQVVSSQQGSSNDFSLSGLIGGNAFSGFAANNSAITLDPATGFQLTIGTNTYSTLGKLNGINTSLVPTLSSNTTIDALASWVNGLNKNVGAAVVGSAGDYSLQLNPKNGASFTTAGLPSAYVTGFNSPTELVTLDPTNGFQVSIGGKTYQTAGAGAITITGTGVGGGVTVGDLANWINKLSGANLSASVVGSGGNYSLEVNNTNLLQTSAISLAGIGSSGGTATTTISGFSSSSTPLSLSSLSNIKLHVGTSIYSGTAIVGTGLGGSISLSNIASWINGLGAGLTASISGSGQAYSLGITGSGSSAISLEGLKANAVITGFFSGDDKINLDSGGFQITANGNTYSTTGSYTLSSLAAWINSQSGLKASVIGAGSTYDLVITHDSDLSADQTDINISGILSGTTTSNSNVVAANSTSGATTGVYTVAVTQASTTNAKITIDGFNNYNDQVDPNYSIIVDGVPYSAATNNAINGHDVSAINASGIGVDNSGNAYNYSTLSDLNDWINRLSGAGLSISSTISGTPKFYNNDFSDIHVKDTPLLSDGSNLGDPYYELFYGGAPGGNDPHAISPNLFDYESLDTSSSPYSGDQFSISTDGQGNIILSAYSRAGVLAASETVAMPTGFSKYSHVPVAFADMGVVLNLRANANDTALANLSDDLISAANALVGNVGQYGQSLDQSGAPNSIIAMESAGVILGGFSTSAIDLSHSTLPTNVDINGNLVVDRNGNLTTIDHYLLTADRDGNGNATLHLKAVNDQSDPVYTAVQSVDSYNQPIVDSYNQPIYQAGSAIEDIVPIDAGAASGGPPSLVVGNLIYNFANCNLSLSLDLSNLPAIPGFDIAGAIASQITFADPVPSYSDYINTVLMPADTLSSGDIAINNFNLPGEYVDSNNYGHSLGYVLTSGENLKTKDPGVVLSVYDTDTGNFLASKMVTIAKNYASDPAYTGNLKLDFGNLGILGMNDIQLNLTVNTPISASEITKQLASNFSSVPTLPSVNQGLGPLVGKPLYVGDITELDYSNIASGFSNFLASSNGNQVTISAYSYNNPASPTDGIHKTGQQTLTVPNSITAGTPFVMDFNDIGGQGGLKFVINPKISTSDYPIAADLISQSINYANKEPGVPGWLTEDNGSGLSLKISGSNGVQITDNNSLSANDEISNASLILNHTSVSAMHTNAKYTITKPSGDFSDFDAVANGTTQVLDGTTFTIDTSATASAIVKVSGSHVINQVTPISSSIPGVSLLTVGASNVTSEYTLHGGISKFTTAQDAKITIDGVNIVRSTNTISDFVPGLTFHINANPLPGATKKANINVTLGTDNTQNTIVNMMTAYNKLITDYNIMTANANNGKSTTNTAGTFGNDPTMLSFVEGIKRRFANGATYNIGSLDSNHQPYVLSLSELGMVIQLDGTLSLDTASYQTAVANGLRSKLIQGARIGYISQSDNLSSFIQAQSSSIGAISQEISAENSSVQSLQKEQQNLQDRLNKIQDSYIAQYSGLNALLFQLNSTSTNLASALTALTNMSAGK
jgi:flagellar capping protein FliD